MNIIIVADSANHDIVKCETSSKGDLDVNQNLIVTKLPAMYSREHLLNIA